MVESSDVLECSVSLVWGSLVFIFLLLLDLWRLSLFFTYSDCMRSCLYFSILDSFVLNTMLSDEAGK